MPAAGCYMKGITCTVLAVERLGVHYPVVIDGAASHWHLLLKAPTT